MFSRLGILEEIISDLGTQFVSVCLEELNRLLGIRNQKTTPYHPKCNAMLQRFNRTHKPIIKNSFQSTQENGTDLSMLCWSHTESFLKSLQDFLHLNCPMNRLCADQFCKSSGLRARTLQTSRQAINMILNSEKGWMLPSNLLGQSSRKPKANGRSIMTPRQNQVNVIKERRY